MRIESGPASTDRNWHLVRAVLFLAFAAYFVYDGAIGYPNKNRVEALKKLDAPTFFNGQVKWADLGETPTKATYERLQKTQPTTAAEVHEALGEPQYTTGSDEYFISRYGYGKITLSGARIRGMTGWIPWLKTREEVRGQFYWALIPALPGLYFLWRLFKSLALRVTIDEQGMTYAGQHIAFDSMVSLRDHNPKGWIDLYYKVDDDERKLRLDNEKVRLFDEIVDAICQTKGFKNEVKVHQEQQARRKADEEAAAAAEDAGDGDLGEQILDSIDETERKD